MFDIVIKGGVLMVPIVLCSVISAAIILERFYFFYKSRTRVVNLLARIRYLLKKDQIQEAQKLCEGTSGPIARILSIGLHIRKRPLEERERIVELAVSKELRQSERNLSFLVIIGNITPLIGLLGTVQGMIKTFMSIQESSGIADVTVLAGGIWEALITTAAGLSVAIPTMVFHHFFDQKVDNSLNDMREAAADFLTTASEST